MLQQTLVSTVIPYYDRFLKRFPSLRALAKAPTTDVLETWSGLGYYSRAKNLHAAAQKVASEHGGRIPEEVDQLLKLPGIGRYTAGAVASIAYDRPAPILDGNVIRVLCRYFGIRQDPRDPQVQRKLWGLSLKLVPQKKPGDFNQALMELGALLCTPRDPQCPACPLHSDCRARKQGLQEQIPRPRPGLVRKQIHYLCGILERNGSVLLARRPLSGLLPGLWEFPGGERGPGESEAEGLARHFRERLGIEIQPGRFRVELQQTLSHRELEIRSFDCRRTGGRLRPRWYTETGWVPKEDLPRRGLTAGMSKLARKLFPFILSLSKDERTWFDKLTMTGGILVLLTTLTVAGCASVGPPIDREELKSAQEFYRVKALRHAYGQAIRVRTVGERLLAAVPQEEWHRSEPKPDIGILLDDLTPTSARVLGIPGTEADIKKKRACLIVGALPNSPAAKAGLQAGDLLLRIGTKESPSIYQAVNAFHRFKPNDSVPLLLEREGVRFERTLVIGAKLHPIRFQVDDDPQVNAYAAPGQIVVTSGLLRFVASDDELAIAMAHETAHLTRGHIAKGMGTGIIGGILGATVGTAVDIVLPGAGDIMGQAASAGVQAPFSQDFEREADTVGLEYAYRAGYRIEAALDFWDRFATELPQSISHSFFNTHPTSPERLLRLKKAIEQIRTQNPSPN